MLLEVIPTSYHLLAVVDQFSFFFFFAIKQEKEYICMMSLPFRETQLLALCDTGFWRQRVVEHGPNIVLTFVTETIVISTVPSVTLLL